MSTAVRRATERHVSAHVDAEVADRRCPQCGSLRVHRSRRRTFLDRVLTLAGGVIRRCQDCRRRQAWFRSTPVVLDLADSPTHKWADLAVVGSGIALCVLFGMWIAVRIL